MDDARHQSDGARRKSRRRRSGQAENAAASNPGASAGANETAKFLDLGPYPLDQEQTVSFDEPSTLPPFTTEGIVTRLGPNTVRGDGPNQLAPEHAESQRLADALNRLAANALDGAEAIRRDTRRNLCLDAAGSHRRARRQRTSGHGRRCALLRELRPSALQGPGRDDALLDRHKLRRSRHRRPARLGRATAARSGLTRRVRVAASAARRSTPTSATTSASTERASGAPWTRSISPGCSGARRTPTPALRRSKSRASRGFSPSPTCTSTSARPDLPFGGYYALGVCQDGVAAIEEHMTGKVNALPQHRRRHTLR